jgi:hypothetical protein
MTICTMTMAQSVTRQSAVMPDFEVAAASRIPVPIVAGMQDRSGASTCQSGKGVAGPSRVPADRPPKVHSLSHANKTVATARGIRDPGISTTRTFGVSRLKDCPAVRRGTRQPGDGAGSRPRKGRSSGTYAFIAVMVCSISICISAAAQTGDVSSRLGVAVRGQQSVCLSIPRHGLAAGTPLALVQADDPPAVATAAIIGAGGGCPGERSHGMVGYRLRITKGAVRRDAALIAVLGGAVPTLDDGLVQADLQGGGRMATFRSCTSADGVHLTVWDGASQQARRLWHDYYYLGQDLEPSCSDRETAE